MERRFPRSQISKIRSLGAGCLCLRKLFHIIQKSRPDRGGSERMGGRGLNTRRRLLLGDNHAVTSSDRPGEVILGISAPDIRGYSRFDIGIGSRGTSSLSGGIRTPPIPNNSGKGISLSGYQESESGGIFVARYPLLQQLHLSGFRTK